MDDQLNASRMFLDYCPVPRDRLVVVQDATHFRFIIPWPAGFWASDLVVDEVNVQMQEYVYTHHGERFAVRYGWHEPTHRLAHTSARHLPGGEGQ